MIIHSCKACQAGTDKLNKEYSIERWEEVHSYYRCGQHQLNYEALWMMLGDYPAKLDWNNEDKNLAAALLELAENIDEVAKTLDFSLDDAGTFASMCDMEDNPNWFIRLTFMFMHEDEEKVLESTLGNSFEFSGGATFGHLISFYEEPAVIKLWKPELAESVRDCVLWLVQQNRDRVEVDELLRQVAMID